MPFRSKAQMKACYATDGFGGKIDCAEWQKDTPKKLPKRVKKKKAEGGLIDDPLLLAALNEGRDRPKVANTPRIPTKAEMQNDPDFYARTMDAGNYGYSGIADKNGKFSLYEALINEIEFKKNNQPTEQWPNQSNNDHLKNRHITSNYRPQAIPMAKKGGKMWAGGWPIPNPNPDDSWTNFPQTLSKERNPPPNPYQQLPTQASLDNVSGILSRSLADPQKQLLSKDNTPYALANGPEMNSYDNTTNMPQKKKIDPFFLLRGATTALGWLAGKKDRNRQQQYMMNQYSSMGQLDPVNINDYQPNPYNQYSKKGGNIYKAEGGDADLDFLFGDDDAEEGAPVTAPTARPQQEEEQPSSNMEGMLEAERQYNMAMDIAMADRPARARRYGNVADAAVERPNANPYVGDILSEGAHGASNVGPYGRQIYGELAEDLGYKPVANSIYRDPKQQEKLVKQGVGAKNSWHLTGNAVDIKPKDWNNLPDSKKAEYKQRYDVKFHNNHYHLEPK